MEYRIFFEETQKVARVLSTLSSTKMNEILLSIGEKVTDETNRILKENQKDLDRMDASDPKYDRLKLTKERIEGMVSGLKSVALLPSPTGTIGFGRINNL